MENEIRKEPDQYRVRDIQSRPAILKESTSIYDAIVTLFVEDTGSVFIVGDDGFLSGVVSRKDCLKTTLGQAEIHNMLVSIIMTRMPNIVSANLDETVVEVVRKIVEHEVDSLPVVKCFLDANGEERFEVVGKISKTNIARLFLDLAGSGR